MQKSLLSTLLFTASLALPLRASDYPAAGREGIEWCDIWISHANESALPRVLLIGDSITRAYYPEVEKRLAGKAYVGRLATSAFLSDPVILQQVAMVLDQVKPDVVHFNNGMHGWQHSEEEYRQAFPEFLATIQKHAPHAKLIWAATTPLKDGSKQEPGRASDARIAARNAIALEFVQPKGIAVDDLFTPMVGHPDFHPEKDNVHFNPQGVAQQAGLVAEAVAKVLPAK